MLPALVTIVRGRHDHLRRQRAWISAMDPPPSHHIVVSMDDAEVPAVVAEVNACPTTVLPLSGEPMPLAAARNLGAVTAAELGAEQVVLLDVDCLPSRTLVQDYVDELDQCDQPPSVICGRVRYLPEGLTEHDYTPDVLWRVSADHALRVVPDGTPVPGDPRLLWSLNLGLRLSDWERVGGFDEAYTGYGGEDTDFGQRLAAVGGTMWWSQRALAYHQYHPISSPPVEHTIDIARNANLFRQRWGFDPMEGWLRELRELGWLQWSENTGWRPVNYRGDNALMEPSAEKQR